MTELFVTKAQDLKEGAKAFVENGASKIGVLRTKGKLHAFLNVCPHQGGPVCEGLIIHKVEEVIADDKTYKGMRFSDDELHVVCPWHGWEFDIETGRCAGDGRHELRRYDVVERGDEIYVVL